MLDNHMSFFLRRIVIDTLKEVDGDRKCFRMVGGLLCERTVKDVLPILISNQEQVKFVLLVYMKLENLTFIHEYFSN